MMNVSMMSPLRGGLLALALVATATLTGCASGDAAPKNAAGAAASDFLACLTTAGVDAQIDSETKMVMVKGDATEMPTEDGVTGTLGMAVGDGGTVDAATMPKFLMVKDGYTWVAATSSAYFVDDPETQDAYAECEKKVPAFEQPDFKPQDTAEFAEAMERMQKSALAFAECARTNGYSWVADPTPEMAGVITLPADLTEDEFTGLITACADEAKAGIAWNPEGELSFDWNAVLIDVLGEEYAGMGMAVTSQSGGDE